MKGVLGLATRTGAGRVSLLRNPALCLAAPCLAFMAAPLSAQTSESGVGGAARGGPPSWLVQVPDGCSIIARPSEDESVKMLHANCRGHGIVLGSATEYSTHTNDVLDATVVDMRLGTDRRVLLLTLLDDGRPLVEDISGQIADAAGLGPLATIEDLQLDLENFDNEATLGVSRPGTSARGAKDVRQLSLGQQIVLEKSR